VALKRGIPRSGKTKEKEGREARARPKGKPPPAPRRSPGATHLSLEPTWGQTEGKNTELEQSAPPAETNVLSVSRVDGDVEVGVPQIDRGRPIPRAYGVAEILWGLHTEVGSVQVGRIQPFEVDHGPHAPILLLHKENGADEAGRRGMQGNLLDGPFRQHGLHLNVDEVVVRSLRRSGEIHSRAGERGRRREGGR
jgi:hypothetical protein